MNKRIVSQHSQEPQRTRDERVPASVHTMTIKGVKYTVKVYDEQGYQRMKEQYCTEDEQGKNKAPGTHKKRSTTFQRQKPIARYNWTKKAG